MGKNSPEFYDVVLGDPEIMNDPRFKTEIDQLKAHDYKSLTLKNKYVAGATAAKHDARYDIEFVDLKNFKPLPGTGLKNPPPLPKKGKIQKKRVLGLKINYADRLLGFFIVRWWKNLKGELVRQRILYLKEYIANHKYDDSELLKEHGVEIALRSEKLNKVIAEHVAAEQAKELEAAQDAEEKLKEELKIQHCYSKAYQIDYLPVEFFDKFIELNPDQQNLLEYPKPFKIHGPPGCGKTVLTGGAYIAKGLEEGYGNTAPIYYVTKSKDLAHEVQNFWARSPCSDGVGPEKVRITSYAELVEEEAWLEAVSKGEVLNTPDTRKAWIEKTFVTSDLCQAWIKNHIKNYNATHPDEDNKAHPEQNNVFFGNPSFNEKNVYNEFLLLCGYTEENIKHYLGSGERQSIFHSEEQKKFLWELIKKFFIYLQNNKIIHVPFYRLKNLKSSLMLIDEYQDFSSLQLYSLCESANFEDTVLSGDPFQKVGLMYSQGFFLQKMYIDKKLILPTHMLFNSYRCSAAVTAAANKISFLMNVLIDGTTYEHQYLQMDMMDSKKPGFVKWYNKKDDPLLHEKLQQKLRESQSTDFVVITLPEFLGDAEKEFPGALVCTVNMVKGRQFKRVLGYRLFDGADHQKMFEEAHEYLEEHANDALNPHKAKRSRVCEEALTIPYTIATRALDDFILYQDDNSKIARVLNYVKVETEGEVIFTDDGIEISSYENDNEFFTSAVADDNQALAQQIFKRLQFNPKEKCQSFEEKWKATTVMIKAKKDLLVKKQEDSLPKTKVPDVPQTQQPSIDPPSKQLVTASNKDSNTKPNINNTKWEKKNQNGANYKKPVQLSKPIIKPIELPLIVTVSTPKNNVNNVAKKLLLSFTKDNVTDSLLKNPNGLNILFKPIDNPRNRNKKNSLFQSIQSDPIKCRIFIECLESRDENNVPFIFRWLQDHTENISKNVETILAGFTLEKIYHLLNIAYAHGRDDVASLLRRLDTRLSNQHHNSLLFNAARLGCTEIVKMLIKNGVDVDILTTGGKLTPLYLAAWRGHADMVNLLLPLTKKNLLACDYHGMNALEIATKQGHKQIVEAFIKDDRSCPFSKNKNNLSAFEIAVLENHESIVKLFLDHPGITKKIVEQRIGENDSTLLHYSVKKGHVDTANLLLKKTDDPNILNLKVETPLHLAVWKSQHEIVKLLLNDPRVDINYPKEGEDVTPLQFSVTSLENHIFDLFFNDRRFEYKNTFHGFDLLQLAIKRPNFEVVKKLLQRDDISQYAKIQGIHPFIFAIIFFQDNTPHNTDIIAYLARHYPDYLHLKITLSEKEWQTIREHIGLKDVDGLTLEQKRNWTPLHFFIYFKHPNLINYFAKYKIKFNTSESGITPMELIQHMQNKGMDEKTLIEIEKLQVVPAPLQPPGEIAAQKQPVLNLTKEETNKLLLERILNDFYAKFPVLLNNKMLLELLFTVRIKDETTTLQNTFYLHILNDTEKRKFFYDFLLTKDKEGKHYLARVLAEIPKNIEKEKQHQIKQAQEGIAIEFHPEYLKLYNEALANGTQAWIKPLIKDMLPESTINQLAIYQLTINQLCFCIEQGFLEILKDILQNHPELHNAPQAKNPLKQPPNLLQETILKKQTEAAKILLYYYDPTITVQVIENNEIFYESLPCFALTHGNMEIFELFLTDERTLSNDELFNSMLHRAVELENTSAIRLILKNIKHNTLVCNKICMNSLSLAMKRRNVEIIKLLIQQNDVQLDLDAKNTNDILHLAAQLGCVELLMLVLDKTKVDVNALSDRNTTSLRDAVEMLAPKDKNKLMEVIELLCMHPAITDKELKKENNHIESFVSKSTDSLIQNTQPTLSQNEQTQSLHHGSTSQLKNNQWRMQRNKDIAQLTEHKRAMDSLNLFKPKQNPNQSSKQKREQNPNQPGKGQYKQSPS